MEPSQHADSFIQLRASRFDRDLIDRAAQAKGMNRTQFIMSVVMRDAKQTLLEQTALFVDSKSFTEILDQLDNPTPPSDGLKKTLTQRSPWDHAQ